MKRVILRIFVVFLLVGALASKGSIAGQNIAQPAEEVWKFFKQKLFGDSDDPRVLIDKIKIAIDSSGLTLTSWAGDAVATNREIAELKRELNARRLSETTLVNSIQALALAANGNRGSPMVQINGLSYTKAEVNVDLGSKMEKHERLKVEITSLQKTLEKRERAHAMVTKQIDGFRLLRSELQLRLAELIDRIERAQANGSGSTIATDSKLSEAATLLDKLDDMVAVDEIVRKARGDNGAVDNFDFGIDPFARQEPAGDEDNVRRALENYGSGAPAESAVAPSTGTHVRPTVDDDERIVYHVAPGNKPPRVAIATL